MRHGVQQQLLSLRKRGLFEQDQCPPEPFEPRAIFFNAVAAMGAAGKIPQETGPPSGQSLPLTEARA